MPERSVLEEFTYRRSLVANLAFDEAQARLTGFYRWLLTEPRTKRIVDSILSEVDVDALLDQTKQQTPPKASEPNEITAIALRFLQEIADGAEPFRLSFKYGITPSYNTPQVQAHYDELVRRYIEPGLDYVERVLQADEPDDSLMTTLPSEVRNDLWYPPEIESSLKSFKKDHPDSTKNAFIMMKFGTTGAHERILTTLKSTLGAYGISGLRSDDKEYHDDLFDNVLTYIHGCSFGIAVFERLLADEFNPNVSLEVGYMLAVRKSVCLLKDCTLSTLHTDLAGKLYREFDPQDPEKTIPGVVDKWLRDKDIPWCDDGSSS